jgi:hypothetical protein
VPRVPEAADEEEARRGGEDRVVRDAVYRYGLRRHTGVLGATLFGVFVMLNPSTADDAHDDATIRRCKTFAYFNEWAGFVVVNLFAARATDPATLTEFADPVGPENDAAIRQAFCQNHGPLVAAWGVASRPLVAARVRAVVEFLGPRARWSCLGLTADGSPRHPLYVRSAAPLVEWPAARWVAANAGGKA